MRRRWRQPSLNGDSFDSPPRRRRAIGSSRISRPLLDARLTISDPGAGACGTTATAVVGVVVDDDHFAVDPVLVEDAPRRGHALADALGFVQAGDDDRHADGIARRFIEAGLHESMLTECARAI